MPHAIDVRIIIPVCNSTPASPVTISGVVKCTSTPPSLTLRIVQANGNVITAAPALVLVAGSDGTYTWTTTVNLPSTPAGQQHHIIARATTMDPQNTGNYDKAIDMIGISVP